MSTQNKNVKFYKNPQRNQVDPIKPFVPQYQKLGLEPTKYPATQVVGNVIMHKPTPLPLDNPRATRPMIRRQSYGETAQIPIGNSPLPNVGNSIEQSWTGMDGEVILDDISSPGDTQLDPNQPMIDNNDFVSDQALGNQVPYATMPQQENFVESFKQTYKIAALFKNINYNECLLIVNGEILCSGLLEDIQEQVRALVFGEHSEYPNQAVAIDDIVVMKRMQVKAGVFIEQ